VSGQAPVLWSFRRCPYAIRARLALSAAGLAVELREVSLQAKPAELLAVSPKGTVPVLEGPASSGRPVWVIEESLEVMHWALGQSDPQDLLRRGEPELARRSDELVAINDGTFKGHLDRFKYASRYPGADATAHRQAALAVLHRWNAALAAGISAGAGGWLLGSRPCLADLALLPFVRQFRLADPAGFDNEPGLGPLQHWLERFLASEAFSAVMGQQLRWRSPRFLYHLALAAEWDEAEAAGVYLRSTRGQSLEQVGFIHASWAHQLAATYQRFYADAGAVRLLTIDPDRLTAPLKLEPVPPGGERFPHLYGPLPIGAVLAVERYPA